jgi:hypothetical protein
MIKKSPPPQQNIYQNQSKQSKNGEAHGGVRQDKYAGARVHKASGRPVMDSDPARTSLSNTTIPRTKKHSKKRRLSQLATWVEDPIVFKVRKIARAQDLSLSAALREIILTGLKDEVSADEALAKASLRESHARDTRQLGKRLMRFLVWLLYDVGQIKVLATNTLGMQEGMNEGIMKDIVRDADRQTKARFSRMNPELSGFIDEVVDQWLRADEEKPRGGRP